MDIKDYEPYNNDGMTDNVPKEIAGGKQTAMLIQRMMAWKAQDFTKGADRRRPVTAYRKQRQQLLSAGVGSGADEHCWGDYEP